MAKNSNIEAYIARRIERELDKNLAAMIEKRLRNFAPNNFVRQQSTRYSRNALNDLTKSIYQSQFQNTNLIESFGNSESQFMNIFVQEIKNSIFRNF